MKEIINVEITSRTVDFSKCVTDLLVIGHFSDAKGLDKIAAELDRKLGGNIEKVLKLGDFSGKEGTCAVIYGNGGIGAKRVLLTGLGEIKKASIDTVRKAAASAANKAVSLKVKMVSLALHRWFSEGFKPDAIAQAIMEGAYFGAYRYDEFVTQSENGRLASLKVELIDPDLSAVRKMAQGIATGVIIGNAQSFARTLSNRPGNMIRPPELAAAAKKLASGLKGVTCTVLDDKQLAAKGMGGIAAVGSGSESKPRFIVLKYTPSGKKVTKLSAVGLVGKAITFDSGGISIKPATDMDQMKLDKSGGITVMSVIKAASDLKLPMSLYGIIPCAENLPSGSSYRPGDIVKTFSGKTVEIQNTDAEGRMILCDAISYAVSRKCDIIIDIATLTGACMVALGKYMAGLMGNDDILIKDLLAAGEESGEKVWHMPSGDEYAEEMKSKIADLKNIGSRWGGACTAATFLRQFVDGKKWAHLNIAGMDMFDKATAYASEGSSGFGVRLLTTYLMNIIKSKK